MRRMTDNKMDETEKLDSIAVLKPAKATVLEMTWEAEEAQRKAQNPQDELDDINETLTARVMKGDSP